MKIFVIGSYKENTSKGTKANIAKANNAGIEIMKKGHLPLVPQSMLAGWEDKLEMEQIMQTCFKWIEECDAVLILNIGSENGGTARAKKHAVKTGKIIYHALEEIPSIISLKFATCSNVRPPSTLL